MKKFINTIIALFILWTYEPGVIDTLEMTESLDEPVWVAVAGPYLFSPSGESYMVLIVPELPQAFFRVRREWPSE